MTDRPEFEEDAWEPYHEEAPQTCTNLVGYWKNAMCGDPVSDGEVFCGPCAASVTRWLLDKAVADGDDPELVATLRQDLADLGVNEELAMAA